MRKITTLDYNFNSSIIEEFNFREAGYNFIIDKSDNKVKYTKNFLVDLEDSYKTLTNGDYKSLTYDNAISSCFLLNNQTGKIELFKIKDGDILNNVKISEISDIFPFDDINFSPKDNSLYLIDKDNRLLEKYSIPYIPSSKIINKKLEDFTVINGLLYTVGNNKLNEIDFVLDKETNIKSYSSQEPFKIASRFVDNYPRLYILKKNDTGLEEYLINNQASVFYAQESVDPYDIFISESGKVYTSFSLGSNIDTNGELNILTPEENTGDASVATFDFQLFNNLKGIGLNESNLYLYCANYESNLIVVLDKQEGFEPLSLISLSSSPKEITYSNFTKLIYCLTEDSLIIIRELDIIKTINLNKSNPTRVLIDDDLGFILVGFASGELDILNEEGDLIQTIFSQVGSIKKLLITYERGKELLIGGDNGILSCIVLESNQSFSKDNQEDIYEIKALDKERASVISSNINYIAIGYNSGHYEFYNSDFSSKLSESKLDGEIKIIESFEDIFIIISGNNKIVISKGGSKPEEASKSISADTWRSLIVGNNKQGETEVLVVGVSNVEIIPINKDVPSLGESTVINLSNQLGSQIDISSGYFIPSQNRLPSEIEVRDSLSFRRQNPNYTGPVINVVRDDGESLDIKTNNLGELDITNMEDFANGQNGYLNKIYGQFGKFNLYQDNPSNRPLIVFNGITIKTEQGNPTAEFSGNEYMKIDNNSGLDLSDTIRLTMQVLIRNSDFPQTIFSKGNYFLRERNGNLIWETRPGVALSWSSSGSLGNSPVNLVENKNSLYAICKDDNEVYIFNNISSWLSVGKVGDKPLHGSSFNNILYVSSYNSNEVYWLNDSESKWEKAGGLKGKTPFKTLNFDNSLFITCKDSNEVYYLSDNLEYFFHGQVDDNPTDIIEHNNEIFVTCEGDYSDINDNGIVNVYRNNLWQPTTSLGNRPNSFAKFSNNLYASCSVSKDVWLLSGSSTWERLADIPGNEPGRVISIDGINYTLYRGSNSIGTIDQDKWTNNIASPGSIGDNPVDLIKDGTTLLTVCSGSNEIYKKSTNWEIETSNVGSNPTSIELFNNKYYVTAKDSNEIYAKENGTWSLEATSISGDIGTKPSDLKVFNNTLFTICEDSKNIWKTTGDGTWQQEYSFNQDFNPKKFSQYLDNIVVLTDEYVYWKTSGTWSALSGRIQGSLVEATELNNYLFIVTDNDNGTSSLIQLDSGGNSNSISTFEGKVKSITSSNGTIWISTSSPGNFFYNTDTIKFGKISSSPKFITSFKGNLWCLTDDGFAYYYDKTHNLWHLQNNTSIGNIGDFIVITRNSNDILLFTRPSANDVYSFDGTNFNRYGNNSFGSNPLGIFEYKNEIYVCNEGSNDLFKLEESSNDWIKVGDLGLSPQSLNVFNDSLITTCKNTNDLLSWDGNKVSRINECGYKPTITQVYNDNLYVFCEGISGDLGKGLYKFKNNKWIFSNQIFGQATDSIIYNDTFYVSYRSSSDLYALKSGSWQRIATNDQDLGEGSISDGPTKFAVYENYLYLICKDAKQIFRYRSDIGWEVSALSNSVGDPIDISSYGGFIYVINENSEVYRSDGGAWELDKTVNGTKPSEIREFSSKLHTIMEGSNEGLFFPDYLQGQTLSKSNFDSSYQTISVEIGNEVRFFQNDSVVSTELPEQQLNSNDFDFTLGVGFDFSVNKEVSIRGDNFNGQIAEFHISASSSQYRTDLIQSYLYSYYLVSGNYYLYDLNSQSFIVISNDETRTITTKASPINNVKNLIYDYRQGSLLYSTDSKLFNVSLNNRILSESQFNKISNVDINDSHTIVYDLGQLTFAGKSISNIFLPKPVDISINQEHILTVEDQTSYSIKLDTPDAKKDRILVNSFDERFVIGGTFIYNLSNSNYTIYDKNWIQQGSSNLPLSTPQVTHYVPSTRNNNLENPWIFIYDGEDLVVYEERSSLSQVKVYSGQPFYNPTNVEEMAEVWFISNNSLRKIPANNSSTTNTSVNLIKGLSGEFSNKDSIAVDEKRKSVVVTNRNRQTIVEYDFKGNLVMEYEISYHSTNIGGSTAFASNRVPVSITYSRVDGYLYCLSVPNFNSQNRNNELLVINSGIVIESIIIPQEFGNVESVLYSSEFKSICVKAKSSTLCYQNRILTKTISNISNEFLPIEDSLNLLNQTKSQGWSIDEIGESLTSWFDGTNASSILRRNGEIEQWLDEVSNSNVITNESNHPSPLYNNLTNAKFQGAEKLKLKDSQIFNSDLIHLALDINNNGKIQTIFSNEKSDLTYRDENLTFTLKGEAKGFYPLSGTQGSPRSMAKFQDRYYIAIAGKDEVWKYEFTASNGQPDSLPKWQVFQSDSSLKEPEYLYEYDNKLWCCYGYSNTIASVEDSSTREVFNFADDKIRPRRMIEWNGNLFVSFFGSDHIGKYNSTDGWSFTTVGRKPYDFVIFNNQLLVTCGGSDEIWVTSDGNSWSVWVDSKNIGENSEARGLIVSGGYLFVACYRSNEIRRYDGSNWSIDSFEGEGPINFETGVSRLFVACYDSSDVYELSSPSNTTWNQNSSLGEGVYDLVFLSSPTDITLPETGEPFSGYVYALCAEDTSGQVFYSKGTTFDTFEGRDVIEYFPELDTYFSRHPKSDNEVVYFDGLHWIPCFDSAYFYSNESYNNFNLYYDSASASFWVVHDRGLFFKTVDGINWTLERGLQATNDLKGFTVADGTVYVLDEVNNSAVLHKYEGNYKWSKKYPPQETGSIAEICTFVSQGISYVAIIVGVSHYSDGLSTQDKLWVFNPITENWYVEFQSSRSKGTMVLQKGNYLYVNDSTRDLHDLYRADLSSYEPENGNHLQFNLVGDGSQNLSKYPSDLEIYNGNLYVACGRRDNEVYYISLSGDISTNSWTLSGSFSDGVNSIKHFSVDDSLYLLIGHVHKTLYRLDNGSWVDLNTDAYYTYGDSSSNYRGLQEYKGKLVYTLNPNYGLVQYDGSTKSSIIDTNWNTQDQQTEGSLSTTINGRDVLLFILSGSDNNPTVFFYDESQDRIEFLTFRLPRLLNRFGKTFLYYGGGLSPTKAYTPYYEVNNLDTFDLQIEPELSPFFYMDNFYNSGHETIEAVSNEINGEVYIVRKLQNDNDKRIYRWVYGNGNAYEVLEKWNDDIDRPLRQVLAVDYGESFEVFLFSEPGGNGKIFKTSDGENWTETTYSEFTYAVVSYQGTGYRIFGNNLQRRDIESQEWVNESFYNRGSTVSNLISLSGNLYELKSDGGVNLYKKGNMVERKRQLPFYSPNDKILSVKFKNDLMNPSQDSGGSIILHKDYFSVNLQGYNEEINLNNVDETIIGSKNELDYFNGSLYSLVSSNTMSEQAFYNMLVDHNFNSDKADFYKDKQELLIQTYLSLLYKLPFPNKETIKDNFEFILSNRNMLSK